MKRIFFIAFAVTFTVMQMLAAPVNLPKARSTASRFISHQVAREGRHMAPASDNELRLVLAQKSNAVISQPVYYIFNTNDNYVIVSGDDRARDILMWGDRPLDINNIPENMQMWLDSYQEQLEYLQTHPDLEVEKGTRRSTSISSVEPLLTAMWDQGYPYNLHCPEYNGSLCVTGCPATSLAMVFYYWKYPTEPTPTVYGYRTQSLGLELETLEPITFDWDNMLDFYYGNYNSVQADAVAWLMRYLGQDERMDYTPSSSGSYGFNIVQTIKRFGYDQDVRILFKEWWNDEENYTDEEWGDIIQEELANSRPIVMCAYSATMSGHAFNIDGYDANDDTYHINWGWSGSGNAYCALNAFKGNGMTFNVSQQLIVGIEPPATVPTIKAWSSHVNATAFVDSTAMSSFTVKGALLTGDVTLTLNDESGFFSIDHERINYDNLSVGERVNVTYRPTTLGTHTATVTLCSDGAEDKIVTLNGTCLLETYAPVMLEVSDLSESSFNVQWQDATPSHNVVSYNLEIASVPFNEIRLSESFDKNEYTGTSTADCSSKLDQITNTPGWSGSKLYYINDNLVLGSSKSKGWIETPALDMIGNEGLVTIKVNASSTSTDTSTPLKISCGENDTTIIIDSDDAEYCVMLPCPPIDNAKVKLSSATGKRVILKSFAAYAGDDYSPIDLTNAKYFEGITTMPYLVENLTSGSYALRVQTLYTDGTLSPWSNRIRAMIPWKKGDVNHDGEINIADINTIVGYVIQGVSSNSVIANCDVNGDGEVNIADINAVIDFILAD